MGFGWCTTVWSPTVIASLHGALDTGQATSFMPTEGDLSAAHGAPCVEDPRGSGNFDLRSSVQQLRAPICVAARQNGETH